MGELFKDCYECGKTCINNQFCLDGDTPNNNISLPRTLKIKIIANPEYWGFSGGHDDNILVSGYAYFSNGYFDFFYGYEEDHVACKTCGKYQDPICNKNEQRTDIAFRSIVDENGNVVHYNGSTTENVTRGGAEVFLINRTADKTADMMSCISTDPEDIFKKTPENYGFGNKILFNDSIYKNITGAWRLSECLSCYDNHGYIDTKLPVCTTSSSGNYLSKQNIRVDGSFGSYYDPAKRYCTNHDDIYGCIPDGASPDNYKGNVLFVTRDNTTENIARATVSYNGSSASSLRNGNLVFISSLNAAYYIYDVAHSSGISTFSLFGSFSDSVINYTGVASDSWMVANTKDPQSCCGGAAIGIDDTTKQSSEHLPYHIDIKKIFNNSKNKLYSNREKFTSGQPRKSRSRIKTTNGVPATGVGGSVSYVGELPYYGPYYEVDDQDSLLRYSREDHTMFKNATCYTKRQELTIFPDCLVQNMPEKEYCREGFQYKQNVVPRLTFVYRPCNYNDSCSFDPSGHPMTAGASGMPSNVDDLRKGFGGQEIVMHLNLGDAWGTKSRPMEVCGCGDDVPPGEVYYPPDVIVSSPVTFPCFPKFDLNPSGYGCQDPMWWGKFRKLLEPSYDASECIETTYDACWIKQPYTTYGYVRNICGHEGNSRIDVLKSLGAKQHSATYLDTNPENSGLVEPMYVSFPRPMDDTGLGFPTGGNNGFIDENEDGIPDNSGEQQYRAYWGLTDEKGRLAFPYFRTKMDSVCAKVCPNDLNCVSFVNFDYLTTLTEGFPTSHVPFLIEIDHEDYCVGCSTNQIEDKQYYITIESLPAKYFRGSATADATALDDENGSAFKYGFNHCRYPGPYAIPKWESDPERWLVPTGCNNVYVELDGPTFSDSEPYTDETCGCLGEGITVPLRVHKLVGTNTPKYLSTDGGINSYVLFPSGCVEPRDTTDKIMKDYNIYFAAHMHCGNFSSVLTTYDESDSRNYGDLSTLLNCGGCSHSYPATNSKPNLSLDFWYVRKGFEQYFEGYTDAQLTNPKIINFLAAGATFSFLGPYATESAFGGDYEYPIATAGLATCTGGKVVMGDCYPYGSDTCSMCVGGFELAANYGYEANGPSPGCYHYRNGQRTIKLETSVPGCDGSKITLYGYSYFTEPSENVGTDGGFNREFSTGTERCCEQDSCYLGEIPNNIPSFIFSAGPQPCWEGQYKYSGLTSCGALHLSQDCYNRTNDPNGCCRIGEEFWSPNGNPIDQPLWKNHCFAKGAESSEVIGEFLWYPEVSGVVNIGGVNVTSICPEGYYGSLNACHAEMFFAIGGGGPGSQRGFDSAYIMAWDGENIPGVGSVAGAKVGEPAAVRANGSPMYNVGVSTCSLDSSVNKNVKVKAEFTRPVRMTDRNGQDEVDIHLGPVECEKNLAGNILPATCVRPIFPNTMAGIAAGASGVEVIVNRETSYPEIMTVHRVECSGNGYALHVSREFYNHDRIAYATQKYSYGTPPTFVVNKYPIYGKLDGGKEGVLYESPYVSGSTTQPNLYFDICDTGTLPSPSRVLETLPYPIIVPMMARSDYLSPCYPDHSGSCVNGDEVFYESTCISYYDPNSFTESSGVGASGYFSTDSSGNLSFNLTSGGSGYFTCSDVSGVTECFGCARAIFDNPCVSLELSVTESGSGGIKWFVSGGDINYDGCSVTPYPECCDQYIDLDMQDYDDCINEHWCGDTLFPADTTYPISIIGCDVEPKLLCAGLTTQTCPSGDPIYPNFYNSGSGQALYNYYNLVYDEGVLDARFLTDSAISDGVCFISSAPGDRSEPFPKNERPAYGGELNIKTGFVNGTLITNQSPLAASGADFTCTYSCLQEATECGGGFFNNKEFFPRRKYAAGTKVTRYGSLSICAQNAEHSWGSWLSGHIKNRTIDTMNLGGLDDIKYTNLVDPSKNGAYTILTKDVELYDDVIYVQELTTLLGAKHPFFKMLNPQGLDNKSCLMPNSGCFEFLPTHNINTAGITEERFFSGEDVYYTDAETIRRAIASNLVGTSGCLLEPFKIMVDVEPCNERLSHPGTSYPMNLSWVVQGVTAGVCKGWLYTRPGTCAVSTCDSRIAAFGVDSLFGESRIETLYKCTGPDISGGSFCRWNDAITQDECYPEGWGETEPRNCGAVSWTEYHVITGVDGVDYFASVLPQTFNTESAGKGIVGGPVTMWCNNTQITYPELLVCNYEGHYTYPDKCIYPPDTPKCGPGVSPPCYEPGPEGFDYYHKVHTDSEYLDNDFCYYLSLLNNFNNFKTAGPDGCPAGGGPTTGYRNINLLSGDDYCLTIAQAYRDYNCYAADGIQECPFPSVLKITITE